MKAEHHYNESYHSWHKNVSRFGGWANLSKFESYIQPSDAVLDFGCGSGSLLTNLNCTSKLGVEINPASKKEAESYGLQVVSSLAEVPDEWADVIVSNHALEHTEYPLDVLKMLYKKLKSDGKMVLVVPCESHRVEYKENDYHMHLYSWSPSSLANLCRIAGFQIELAEPYVSTWPRNYVTWAKILGRKGFDVLCKINGRFFQQMSQVRVVAKK